MEDQRENVPLVDENDQESRWKQAVQESENVRMGIAASWFSNREGLRRYIGPKRIAVLIGLVALVLLTLHLRQKGFLKPEILENYIRDYPLRSAILFIGIYVVSIMSSLPTLPLNLAAGFFWGGWAGGLIATMAGGLGATFSFLAARIAFGQPLAQRFDHRLVTRLQDEFDQKGWRFIAFVRLNPIFPTGVLNYVFGLTSIRFWTYAWASVIFLFPPSLLFGIIGDRAGTFLVEGKTSDLMRTILIISLAVTLLISLRFFARLISQTKEGT
ncbi:MAG: TVP38/TMEM64 family protein [Leptospirales bacterium]